MQFPLRPIHPGFSLTGGRRTPWWSALVLEVWFLLFVTERRASWGADWIDRVRRFHQAAFAQEVQMLLERCGYEITSSSAAEQAHWLLVCGHDGTCAIACATEPPPEAPPADIALLNVPATSAAGWIGTEAFVAAVEQARHEAAIADRRLVATPGRRRPSATRSR